jgi:hypothetical protein
MIQDAFNNVAIVRNNLDSAHCLQFAAMAAAETLELGEFSLEEIDRATGFQPGGTWPFTMLTWFTSLGLDVLHIENTNFDLFIRDPREELARQGLDEDTIRLFFEITDFDFEGKALQRAIDDPHVKLESRLPTIDDITGGLQGGWLPLISLDATTLANQTHDEFDGHMVLATGHSADHLRLQDPGPPQRVNFDVLHSRVLAAMHTPSESSGTVTMVRRR